MTISTRVFYSKEKYLAFREKWRYAATNMGMSAEQHMLYNIIRGRDPQYGFTPLQRHSNIKGQGTINTGAYQTWQVLHFMKSSLGYKSTTYWRERADRMVEPFGDTFTIEDFRKMTIPEVPVVSVYYGKGMKVAERIFNGEIKTRTSAELMAYYNEPEAEAA